MKKFAFVIFLFAIVLILSSCQKDTPIPPKDITEYYLSMQLDTYARLAEVEQEVVYTNGQDVALQELYLHLYANNYRKDAFTAAYDTKLSYYGGIDITSLQVDGKEHPITYMHDATLLKVRLPAPLQPYAKVTLAIKYTLEIPLAPLRLGMYDRTVNLGNFYPIMAVCEKGEWRLDTYTRIGDPFYSEVANYQVNLTCQRDYVVASSGNVISQEYDNQQKSIQLKQNNIRDFAMVLSKDYLIKSKEVNNTTVNYYYYLDSTPQESLETAANAFSIFTKNFGAYPYEVYNVAESAFYHGGMEYPALSIISATIQDKTDVIVHETAHQWFACLVGTDSINEAYLDEGLATFSTLLYYKLTGDEGSYADNLKQLRNAYVAFMMLEQARQPSYKPKMTKPLHEYKSAYEYEILCYNKSAIMFATLYEVMGKDAFLKGLATFYTQNCYGLAKCSQLIAATSSKRFDSAKILTPFLEGDAIITAIMV